MKRKAIFIVLLILAVAALAAALFVEKPQDRQAAEDVVKTFGEKLRNVSLLESQDIFAESVQENYGELVSARLIDKWISDPKSAPGRLLSNPWPHHIEIRSIKKSFINSYKISGDIIEVTEAELGETVLLIKQPVEIVVGKTNKGWRINDFKASAYKTVLPRNIPDNIASTFSFDYPAILAAEFIYPEIWPPILTFSDEEYSCAITAAAPDLPERVAEKVIDARAYCVKTLDEFDDDSIQTTYTYSALRDNRVVNLEFALRYPRCENLNEPERTECSRERLGFDLNAIIASIMTSLRNQ